MIQKHTEFLLTIGGEVAHVKNICANRDVRRTGIVVGSVWTLARLGRGPRAVFEFIRRIE